MMVPEYIPNAEGMAMLMEELTVSSEMMALGEELATMWKASLPTEEIPGTGTALHNIGEMAASIYVSPVPGVGVSVNVGEWRVILIEHGFIDRAGDFLTFGQPLHNATEVFAMDHGSSYVPKPA
jgi:hypothetical protein